VGCIAVPRMEATAFGVMAVDGNDVITDFVEKPKDPPAMPGHPDQALASMGIYIFNAEYLWRELARDIDDPHSDHDFGRNIVPRAVREGRAVAHPFSRSCVTTGGVSCEQPYWRDVGTIDAYWDANIDLTATVPELDLYDENWPIQTYQPQKPPAKFVHNDDQRRGSAIESLVSGGCIVSGAVHRSVLFSSVRVHSHARVDWSVLMPYVTVGQHARLNRVVVDRSCVIPDGMVIGEDPEEDARRFHRSEQGIVLVTRDMLEKLG
jgi:glucose-1-phosphate adenylyltransferase